MHEDYYSQMQMIFLPIFVNLQTFFEPLTLVVMHQAIKDSTYAYIRPIPNKLLVFLLKSQLI